MKKKKVLILSLLLVCILVVGSSLALLTDTASDYNTMTTGFARIDQLEYERDENGKLIPFIQDQLLIPTTGTPSWADEYQTWEEVGAEGSNQLFADSFTNVKDKFVFVKNTGLVNVYYRTIIAVEAPEGTDITVGNTVYPAIMANVNGNERFDWDFVQLDGETEEVESLYINVDGVRYYVMVANYLEELTPGEVSRPSLLQVYMRKEVTNEMIAKFGPEVDILVFSQAVQSKGYTDARTALVEGFGEISENNHPWLKATFNRISTLSGEVNLTEDLWLVDEPFFNETVTGPLTINGNGHVVNQTITDSELITWDGGTIPVLGTMFDSADGELVTVNDLTFKGTNQIISLGKYVSSNYVNYNTVLNNVNVIDLEIATHVDPSIGVSPAVMVYGNATLNNTNIYGTRESLKNIYDGAIYDMAVVNYSKAILNNSRVDKVYMWYQGHIEVNAGSTIDTLYLIHHDKGIKETNFIVVNEGGKINNVVTRTGTYTYEEWLASRS